MTSRRDFLARLAGGAAAVALGSRILQAQTPKGGNTAALADTMQMDATSVRPVRLPPKPNAIPQLTPDQRDELEHHLHCQCGTCTLDVYTCRTTDFTCPVSPAMHRDVMSLVAGGYNAQEILDAFVSTYGERVLMSPRKSGFNLVGWAAPGSAVIVGAVLIGTLLRKWRTQPEGAANQPVVGSRVDATQEELAHIEAAIRSEDDQ